MPIAVEMQSQTAPSDTRIEVTRDVSCDAWNDFVGSRPDGNFYHLFQWSDINRRQFGHEFVPLVARAQGQIRGVLPLVFVRSRLFGRILCSMPFVNYGGPCAAGADAAQALVEAATQCADDMRADYLELRCASELPVAIPVSHHKVSVLVPLASDPEVLWQAFSSKHRTNIRRIYKNEISVKRGHLDLLDTFYSVMSESWRSLGTPFYRRSYFESILASFPQNTNIFVAHQGNKPVAVAFNGYFGGIVEGMWAGGCPEARNLQANYVLYWEMMQDACRRGYRLFHLGRSTSESGGEQFKLKWNATSKQLHWYFYRPDGGPMPALNVDNPRYALAIRVWSRLPSAVTALIGPHLARLIP